jgi:predicted Zn-ribbon and HTH transcriptional regulator
MSDSKRTPWDIAMTFKMTWVETRCVRCGYCFLAPFMIRCPNCDSANLVIDWKKKDI